MKAVRFDTYGDIDVLKVVEVDPPVAGPGHVVVRMKAAGINPGEASIRKGLLAERWPTTFPSGEGSDLAGVVDEVGEGVTVFAAGNEVLGWIDERASQAELIEVEAAKLVHRPGGVSWEAAGSLFVAGATAYAAVRAVALQPGETVVVSGAAGAVGSVAGQIARIKGARVVGIAGGAEKCRWIVDELGFDVAIDYKGEDVRRALREHAPEGVDVYFDNVGGEILDAVLTRLARGARIVICGAVSQYNATGPVRGPSNYLALLVYRASMTGMVVFDYAARFGEATAALAGWLGEGRLISREHIVEGGVSAFPDALLKLFSGENMGKLVLSLGVE